MTTFLFDLDGTLTDPREGAVRHHGAGALGALWGYGSRTELEGAGAHALCESPAGLPAALAALSRACD